MGTVLKTLTKELSAPHIQDRVTNRKLLGIMPARALAVFNHASLQLWQQGDQTFNWRLAELSPFNSKFIFIDQHFQGDNLRRVNSQHRIGPIDFSTRPWPTWTRTASAKTGSLLTVHRHGTVTGPWGRTVRTSVPWEDRTSNASGSCETNFPAPPTSFDRVYHIKFFLLWLRWQKYFIYIVRNEFPLVIQHSYWKLPFIVDLPIKNGDFP